MAPHNVGFGVIRIIRMSFVDWDRLPVFGNIQQNSDADDFGGDVGAAVREEWERDSTQWKKAHGGGDVDEGLENDPGCDTDGREFGEFVGGAVCDFKT